MASLRLLAGALVVLSTLYGCQYKASHLSLSTHIDDTTYVITASAPATSHNHQRRELMESTASNTLPLQLLIGASTENLSELIVEYSVTYGKGGTFDVDLVRIDGSVDYSLRCTTAALGAMSCVRPNSGCTHDILTVSSRYLSDVNLRNPRSCLIGQSGISRFKDLVRFATCWIWTRYDQAELCDASSFCEVSCQVADRASVLA